MSSNNYYSREFEDKGYHNHHYYSRNRTFSSTTSNHYKNKLAQIGIDKDLRELLERKRLQKEKEKTPTLPGSSSTELTSISRKVKFKEDCVPISRSKSFTSGTNNSLENSEERNSVTKNFESLCSNTPKHLSQHYKSKKKYFVDLQHPTNIKVELKTESGERQCTVDKNAPIAGIKCDLKNSRNVLKHLVSKEINEKSKIDYSERGRTRSSGSFRGKGQRQFDKKNKGNEQDSFKKGDKSQESIQSKVVANVEQALSNLTILDKTNEK